MFGKLITLEGEYTTKREYDYKRPYTHPELMGFDLIDAGKSFVRGTVDVIGAGARGTGHFVMEAGRGISRGDVGRVLKSPFKGVGHSFMETTRGTNEIAELFYRPSRAQAWMPTVAPALLAIAPFTGPAAPFLLAGGAALGTVGKVQSTIYYNDQMKKAYSSNKKAQLEKEQQMKNWLLYGSIAAGGLGIVLMAT
jgi:hypothetical protein